MSEMFLEHIEGIEDPRIPGMILCPLDEMPLSIQVGLLRRLKGCDNLSITAQTASLTGAARW